MPLSRKPSPRAKQSPPRPVEPAAAASPLAPADATCAVPKRLWRTWLAATLVAYALLQFLYVTATPLQTITLPDNLPRGRASKDVLVGIGPDEKEHFLYVLSLADRGELPTPDPPRRRSPEAYVSYQAQHPPLFYALAALVHKVVAPLGPEAVWYVLRGLCALCGALVVLLAARAALVAFPNRPVVVLGAAPFVAFLPMFGHMTGNLSNEPLAMVFGAWAWLQMARIARSDGPLTAQQAGLLGLTLGLAVLTRLTALLWLPAALLVLVYRSRRDEHRTGLSAPLVAFALTLALVAGPWFVRNLLVFGTPILRTFDRPLLAGDATFVDFLVGGAPPPHEFPVIITPLFTALWYASTSWLPFWLVQFYLPGFPQASQKWQTLLLLMDVAVLLVLFLHASRTRRSENGAARPDPAGRVLLWMAGLAVGTCVCALFQQQLYSDWNVVLSAGRYTVAAVPATSLLFLFAVATLVRAGRSARSSHVAAGAVAAALLLFDVYAVSLVQTFYRDNPRQDAVQPIPPSRPN